jgi:hypothetical protein
MTRTGLLDAIAAREALSLLPDVAAQENLEPPSLAQVFVPEQHRKALAVDASVVVGMRGAGKSWWTAVLNSDRHRAFVADQIGSEVLGRLTVRVGFGLDESNAHFPSPDVLARLTSAGCDGLRVWQAVVLRHALSVTGEPPFFSDGNWETAVAWLASHPSEAEELLTRCDQRLAEGGRILLLLFDAFDRLGTDWTTVRSLSGAAFRLGLRLRSRRAIRTKFFVRPDLDEDGEVWQFPDSSKLRHAKVELTWRAGDLYGLVFTHLANSAEFGSAFREVVWPGWGQEPPQRDGVYALPRTFRSNDARQRRVVDALADTYMGRGPKRGYTYTWIPVHLADAAARVSPRSYLLAFRRAAEHTAERYPGHEKALHYAGIQEGVTIASRVRVEEITEDYPWVEPLLEAARGAAVPIPASELTRNWTVECLRKMRKAGRVRLPPRRFSTDPFRSGSVEALVDDLAELAVLYRTDDRRLNMPDIFRVGFGIRRKGGVRPPR